MHSMVFGYGIYDDFRAVNFDGGPGSGRHKEKYGVEIDVSNINKSQVNREINNKWHKQYKGKRKCNHTTFDEKLNKYISIQFKNHGFGNYEFTKCIEFTDEVEDLWKKN